MAKTAAHGIDEYLATLPDERRQVVAAMRKLIRKHLPKGYEEAFRSGMLSYEIPLARYPDTYNKQPLSYVALAAQKNYYAVYLMGAYMSPKQTAALQEGFAREGKKLDMGKSCVRFKSVGDLSLDTIGEVIASTP
ncbi:MAG TPA: DUF1801 domain-containing protein, partial [Thermoanaerobaculia bacterium]|nr:DUF1801 domain-containing protein [Thermoanaerobaculia bacterium]